MSVGPLQSGDLVLLHDRAGRRYPVRLEDGRSSSLHSGTIAHGDLIGREEGVVVTTSQGSRLLALRPTFAERIGYSRRSAQPIYPKDLGAILVLADIQPGSRVLEAGTGTGTLTIALARAVGSEGRVVSYELREEFAEKARAQILEVLGGVPPQVDLRCGDVAEMPPGEEFDRVCLDLPQPWDVIPALADRLRPGGVLFALCPNLSQVQRFVEALRAVKGFGLIETMEFMQRGWAVRDRSLRPLHRMVAHTAFLTFARRLAEPVVFETESEGF